MVAEGLVLLGYRFVNLDDCWAGNRTEDGSMQADPARFPGGMKALADYLHDRGLLLGLYTDVGETTCRGGRPGSWPHYAQDAATFAAWGVDYVKLDWCGHPSGYTAPQLYGNMSHALNSTGRPIFFAACSWGLDDVWVWGPSVTNSFRIGPDHIPLWWTPDTSQDPGQGQGTANIIQHMAGIGRYNGPHGFNNPDFLMTGSWSMSAIDWQTEFSFWCLFSAPLVVATDVRDMSNKQVLLNKEAIAVNQDPLCIGGELSYEQSDGGQLWSKPLSDGSFALIAYNTHIVDDLLNHLRVDVVFDSQYIPGWPNATSVALVRDLWDHRDLGVFNLTFTSPRLKPHESAMYKVMPQ